MNLRRELRTLVLMVGVFLAIYFVPLDAPRLRGAVIDSLELVQWYAREHMIFGLLPAFFIAGAISAFVSKGAVMRYLGARARRAVAYAVASVSGSVLAVCSCTILPLFAGIYARGAGLGPATAFLYSGPAINVIAIFLTARVLGAELGVARAVGAIVFSVVIGLVMHVVFRKDESLRADQALDGPEPPHERPIGHILALFATMVAVLAFANWSPEAATSQLSTWVLRWKWSLTAAAAFSLAVLLVRAFGVAPRKMALAAVPVAATAVVFRGNPAIPFTFGVGAMAVVALSSPGEPREWVAGSWRFAKDILPLLLAGILVVGLLLGGPRGEGLIPTHWVDSLIGGNSLRANLVASTAGGLMYFCTMTEIPIVQGLLGSGMGKGPALAFLLAGPAVSLPNILILRRILGTRKTATYVALVVVMSTLTGVLFGMLAD